MFIERTSRSELDGLLENSRDVSAAVRVEALRNRIGGRGARLAFNRRIEAEQRIETLRKPARDHHLLLIAAA